MVRGKHSLLMLVIVLGATRAIAASASSGDDDGRAAPLIVMADFNRDGIADAAEITPAAAGAPRSLTILLGQPGGSVKVLAVHPSIGSDPQSLVTGDFNQDGIPDIIVGDGDGSLLELLGDGHGNFMPANPVAQVGSVVSIAAGDFNRDGILDLAVSDAESNTATIFLGTGNGGFRNVWSFALPAAGAVFYLATADFNGDGIADLAVTGGDQENFQVMTGNGNGTFTYTPTLSHIRDPNSYCSTSS